jgi:hypothetical protein
MRKITLIFIATTFTSISMAQEVKESAVPTVVKSAFKKKYPTVKTVKWEKEDSNYEAGFTLNKVESSVLLDSKGIIKETENEIPISQLPKGVVEYIKKNHPTAKITEAAKITDSKGEIMYETEIKGKDLFFDATGKFIK